MHRYYNIHTHKPTTNTSTTLAIQNIYEHFDNLQPGLPYSIGLHPAHLSDHDTQLAIIEKLAHQPEILAIGECGLDKLVHATMPLQVAILHRHVELANQLQKPLIIHCVQAHEELLHTFNTHPPQVPVIIHGYNKRDTIADKLITRGYYLSFGAAILRANNPAAEVLQYIGADRFFLETDDAEINIADIYAHAARIRNTSVESLILQLADNFKTAFNQP